MTIIFHINYSINNKLPNPVEPRKVLESASKEIAEIGGYGESRIEKCF